MVAKTRKSSKAQFATVWGELDYICRKIHHWLHKARNKGSANRYMKRLEQVLNELPAGDSAILREDGLALLYELKRDVPNAIRHRKREIELMERLHESVQESVKSGAYATTMGRSILVNRRTADLRMRRAILHALQTEESEYGKAHNANGRRTSTRPGNSPKDRRNKHRSNARKRSV